MISFIVPAFNEEQLLGRTLCAINDVGRALAEPFEVIVADDASTDRTAEIAVEHGARVVAVNHRQIAATRNSGARAAAGEFLFFVDADTVVNEAVVRAGMEAMLAGAPGGGCTVRFDGRVPAFGRVLAAVTMPVYRWCGLAAGCFLFCTREAFDAAGGFDEAFFGGEEVVLSRALGRQGRFVVLRGAVQTSARKLRAYSALEIVGTLMRLALQGPKGVKQREGLDIWYGPRREDPQPEHCSD
jgi:glycosyltransferase involved in cell wall biosynthesis